MRFKSLILLITAFFILSLASCTGRKIGFGVLLWSTDESILQSGEVVQVISDSRIHETYIIKGLKEDKHLELDMKRVAFFKKKKEAQAYAEAYRPFAQTAALVTTDGLPMRDSPASGGIRVYKLKKNQIIKILDKDDTVSQEGSLEGYWYSTLTDDGVRGYCFSPNLTLFDIQEGADLQSSKEEDPYLQALSESVWRPEFFQTMIAEMKIDLNLLKKEYGFFINSEIRTISVSIPDFSGKYEYSEIVKKGEKQYRIEGTPIELAFTSTRHFEFVFTSSDNMFSVPFSALNIDLDTLIQEELLRREELYNTITEQGPVLTSSAYGTIELRSYPNFVWENFERLTPQVIAKGAGDSGVIDFTIFLTPELKERYSGALRFRFNSGNKDAVSSFLYEILDNGIRFTFVPEDIIEENTINAALSSPVIIFFSYPEG